MLNINDMMYSCHSLYAFEYTNTAVCISLGDGDKLSTCDDDDDEYCVIILCMLYTSPYTFIVLRLSYG